jgi:hypothetical protein
LQCKWERHCARNYSGLRVVAGAEKTKEARDAGLFCKKRMMGLEPTTFCMASRRSSQLSYIRERGQYSPAFGVP